MKSVVVGCLLVLTLVISLVSADTIIVPVSVTSTLAGNAGSSVDYLIGDNAGNANPSLHDTNAVAVVLTNGMDATIVTNVYAEHSGTGQNESFVTAKDVHNPVFVFDLGADTSISAMVLWQYGNWAGSTVLAGENDTKNFRLIFHTGAQGGTAGDFDFDNDPVNLSTNAVRMQNRNVNGNIAQQFSFDTATARYVAMRIDTNYGGPRDGLGEVTFIAPSGGPGPSTGPCLTITETDIQFESVSNQSYTIFSALDLTDDSWLTTTNVTATSTNTVVDISPTNAVEFYKIRVN